MNIDVSYELKEFVEQELLPDLNISAIDFWLGLERIVKKLSSENRNLLAHRNHLQRQIDEYHREWTARNWDTEHYSSFLKEIGYIESPRGLFEIETENVDPEIASVAGPQLVVPVSNARFALNAANARWGSLYDALYGTDALPEDGSLERGSEYNSRRGERVIALAAEFLDRSIPLQDGSHKDVISYDVRADSPSTRLHIALANGASTAMIDASKFLGFAVDEDRQRLLFKNNELHIEIVVDPCHQIGKFSAAGVCDVVLESAVTTIQDFEDSVAAVNAEEKVAAYRNWLGLMRGTLTASFRKNGKRIVRGLNTDREYTSTSGETIKVPGRSLLLVRNVGHLMTTNAALDADGNEIFEGILDAVVTSTCAMYDLRHTGIAPNSRTGSMYIVKPKMHGSREVAFANNLFAEVEDMLGLERYTLKIGVMDEERRTSVNLEECIRAVKHRLVFINTGFLDRTGDEIRTSTIGGPMLCKDDIKKESWLKAYEDRNVDVGIRCGLPGRAQIGKGMWPKPDKMREMLDTKSEHPESGASCAWVPSPTAATLHAIHYHEACVTSRQKTLTSRAMANIIDILAPPFGDPNSLTKANIQNELDNNAQGILGYVVRWIDQGVGCSKVPDIANVGLMEDRATLRISSQLIANWLLHELCTEEQVLETLRRMAKIVDSQNAGDPNYKNMAPEYDGIAFLTACDLVFEGIKQPNGYTEPLLHKNRRDVFTVTA